MKKKSAVHALRDMVFLLVAFVAWAVIDIIVRTRYFPDNPFASGITAFVIVVSMAWFAYGLFKSRKHPKPYHKSFPRNSFE